MRAQEVREELVPRQLVVLELCAQPVEVGMVEVLEHLSGQDGWDDDGCLPAQAVRGRPGTLCDVLLQLYPNSHVDRQVEHKPQQPVHKPHPALARRRVDVRLDQTAAALAQHQGPHKGQLAGGVPQSQPPSPEDGARDGDEVEVGEVVVGDLEAGGMVEELAQDSGGRVRWLGGGGSRSVDQKAAAEGGQGLYDEDLVSSWVSGWMQS